MATYRPGLKARYVVCVNNEGFPASLERRKIHQVLPDSQAAAHMLIGDRIEEEVRALA